MDKIAFYTEGGGGDLMLANRFLPAVKEKFPNSEIHFFTNTEGNWASVNLLKRLFPSFYSSFTVFGKRKDQNHKIVSQFGEEVYPADIKNLQDDDLEKLKEFPIIFNGHIDSLKFMDSRIDWLRYYYYFPKPEVKIPQYKETGYILAHLYARPNSPYNVEQWYAISLLNKLSIAQKVVIVTLPEHKDWYSEVFNNPNISIETPTDLFDVFSLAQNCSIYIGIDSGIRYIPYHFSKPVFVISKDCQQYGNPSPSHLIRWLLFRFNVFPLHYDIDIVTKILYNCIQNSAYQLFPYYLENIDGIVVNRKY
jgi:ADP-heptose:LPS heptosyltransferase